MGTFYTLSITTVSLKIFGRVTSLLAPTARINAII